jgi:hypothetical protein
VFHEVLGDAGRTMNGLELHRALIARLGWPAAWRQEARLHAAKWSADRALRRRYRALDAGGARALRRGARVFVFGSGYSLNDLTPAQWRRIAADQTIGFNAFVRQNWVRTDFHIVRGWGEGAGAEFDWRRACGELGGLIDSNPHYRNAVLVVQGDASAEVGNRLLGGGFLAPGRAVFRYRTRRDLDLPTARLEEGLVHGNGTLCDAVNFAAAMGWTEIVLVGVDLYDTRYFFLPPDRTLNTDYRTGETRVAEISDRGQRWDQPHSTFANGAIELFGRWTAHLAARDVRLSVWNPRSLLRAVMPVYVPEEVPCPAPHAPRV